MALPYLPDDIIRTNILTRVAVKSLIRFRSVCKSWNSLILNTDFIKHHLYFTTQNPNDDNLIFTKGIFDDHSGKMAIFTDLAILALSDLSETRLLHVPYSEIDMLGSINGLVCLSLNMLNQFIIWNPAIRQAMIIDSPARLTRSFFGFCWDAMENDFKVVISYYYKTEDSISPLSLYVYSCNLGSWGLQRNSTLSKCWWNDNMSPSSIVRGVPYWPSSCHPIGNQRLVKFDVESKDFRVLPELCVARNQLVIVVNLEECLSALAFDDESIDSLVDVHCFDERYGVWSKTYNVGPITGDLFICGWIKMNNIRIPGRVLGCFKYGGEIVLSANCKYRCYDHKTNKITDLHNQKGYPGKFFSYKASLIFHERMKPQHQVEPTLWK